jgi:predicted RNase H-like HicB family nuclease
MKEAIEHLDGLKEENLPIPEPTTCAKSVDVAV